MLKQKPFISQQSLNQAALLFHNFLKRTCSVPIPSPEQHMFTAPGLCKSRAGSPTKQLTLLSTDAAAQQ